MVAHRNPLRTAVPTTLKGEPKEDASRRGVVCVYVPHGTVPDVRGFSPALVAENQSFHLQNWTPVIACPSEHNKPGIRQTNGILTYYYRRRRFEERWRKICGGHWTPLLTNLSILCKSKTFDILHVHQLEFPVSSFRRRHTRPLPIVAHAHVPNHAFSKHRGVADHYVAVSEHVRSAMVDQGYPVDRVSVVRNGVDTLLFQPVKEAQKCEARHELGLPLTGSVLAFFGRKQTEKGFDVFLKVAEALLLEDPELLVLSIGPEAAAMTDPDYGQHLALRKKLALGGRFYDWPPLPQAALGKALGVVDVTLLPSKVEPQGMAMIESLASGCVTISTNVGGIRESISDGLTGFLLDEPTDVRVALARTRFALGNLPRLAPLREKARESACSRFDWAHSTRHLEDIYARVLAETRGMPPI